MKKKSVIAIFLCLIVLFAACSKTDAEKDPRDVPLKTADEISSDIYKNVGDIQWAECEVKNCEILDRKTDYDAPTDTVKVRYTAENDEVTVTQAVNIVYTYSVNKWVYNAYEYVSDDNSSMTIKANKLGTTELFNKVISITEFSEVNNATVFTKFFTEKTADGEFKDQAPSDAIKVIDHSEDLANLKQNYIVEVTKKTKNFEMYEKISLDMLYGGDGLVWSIDSATLLESHIKALTDISFTDEFPANGVMCKLNVTGINPDGSLIGTFEQDGNSMSIAKSDYAKSAMCGPYFYARRSNDNQVTYFYMDDNINLEMQETTKE